MFAIPKYFQKFSERGAEQCTYLIVEQAKMI